jgi:hypothetical protein
MAESCRIKLQTGGRQRFPEKMDTIPNTNVAVLGSMIVQYGECSSSMYLLPTIAMAVQRQSYAIIGAFAVISMDLVVKGVLS